MGSGKIRKSKYAALSTPIFPSRSCFQIKPAYPYAMEALFVLHIALTAVMTGIIWFVQVIHYPWFHDVPVERFVAYHQRYTHRMGLLAGPLMLVEFTTGMALLWLIPNILTMLNAAGLIVLWASTFGLQVPCHNKLSDAYDARIHARLLHTNWIRTITWTLRTCLLIAHSLYPAA